MRDGERRGYAHSAGQFTQQDPIGIAGGANVYGFAGGDPVNFSDPFGLCPDEKNPACKVGGGVLTLAYSGAAGFGALGAHFSFGIAVNRRGDVMAFGQAGPSVAAGVAVGPELGVQRGSFNDLVGASDVSPGLGVSAAAPLLPSVTVSGSESAGVTGGSIGVKGGAVLALNITNAAVGSGTASIPGMLREAKAAAMRFVGEGLAAARCASGICHQ